MTTPPVIQRWIEILHNRDLEGLRDLLADDAVFVSPVIFAPQEGKDLTLLYLAGAFKVFGEGGDFRYIEQWYGDKSAILEFETTIDGKTVNGVDMIHWNDDDKINHFKVILRPLSGIQAVMPRMAALLEEYTS